jgi:hypothetical protein
MPFFFLTRLNVGDYDRWKPQFEQDGPGARKAAVGHRILRSVDDPGVVYILVEFASREEAQDGRAKLLTSGVLERFPDRADPVIVEEADSVSYL